MDQPKSILIIQTSFIGDVILATPLIEVLKDQYPDASIDFLLRKGNESLLKGHPLIRKVWIWDKKKNKYANLLKILRQVRRQPYDLVLNLQRFASTGLFAALSGSKEIIGFDKNPLSLFFHKKVNHKIGDGTHEVSRNLSLLNKEMANKSIRPVLYPSQTDYESVSAYKEQAYVCMAPASVWFTKQLPVDKWQELIELMPSNYQIYLLGAPGDKDFLDNIIQSSSRDALNLAGKLSLLQSAALMRDAKMNYVNDSAPLHLASSMNATTTAFFCATIPKFGFGPLAEESFIIETKEPLTCRPCGLTGKKACPEGHFNCGRTIDLNSIKIP